MADALQIRAGKKTGMPTLAVREPAYVTDEEALYIGTPAGNKRLCRAGAEADLQAQIEMVAGAVTELDEELAQQQDAFQALELVVQGHEDALEEKLTADPLASLSTLDAAADLAAVIAAYNNLIAAMKASGMMAT